MKSFIIIFFQYYTLITVLGIIRKSRKYKMRFLNSRCLFMDTCNSRLEFGAISSHGATGPLESAPGGSSAGPMTSH